MPWARVEYPSLKITWFRKDYPKVQGDFEVQLLNDKLKVGMCYSHPAMKRTALSCFEEFDGLVLVGTGLGHFPINKIDDHTDENLAIFEELTRFCEVMPVVMSSQTISGEVNMNIYSTGRKLIKIGVLGNNSTITPETAWCKLVFLLSTHEKNTVKQMYAQNIAGENVKLNETPQRHHN